MLCKNCQNTLNQNSKFCQSCGAKVIGHRITMGHLATEMKEGFFSIDSSKPVRTFTSMFHKPEEVIDGYIIGTRKKFIHAFGYFTIAITLSSFFYFIAFNFFPDSMTAAFNLYGSSAGQEEMNADIQKKVFEYQSFLFFIFVPLMALISYVVFYNKRKYNYAEHLVFNLYTYSQISIITIILFFATVWSTTLFSYVQLGSILLQIGLYSYISKRVFNLSKKQLALKILLFLVIFGFVYVVITIATFAVLIATGVLDFQQILETEKARQDLSYIFSSTINWTS